MEQMRKAMAGADPLDDAGDADSPHSRHGHGRQLPMGEPELRAARHTLKSALIEKSGASLAEQKRIAAILERAAAEIRSAGKPA